MTSIDDVDDKDVTVMQVIRTRNQTRGDGKSDPIRPITQYWSMDGKLLAEIDPCPGTGVAYPIRQSKEHRE